MKKKIENPKRKKREENEKRIKRFDPILKEIFSKAAGKIISIAVGEQICQKIEDITSEIEFVKSLRPDMVFRAGEKIFHIEIQAQQDKDSPERMLIYSLAIKEKSDKNLCRLSYLWVREILHLLFSGMNSQYTNSLF
jgi:hypothetical protein